MSFPLPEGRFRVEMIDPWEMKVSVIPGTFTETQSSSLADRPYQAVRFDVCNKGYESTVCPL